MESDAAAALLGAHGGRTNFGDAAAFDGAEASLPELAPGTTARWTNAGFRFAFAGCEASQTPCCGLAVRRRRDDPDYSQADLRALAALARHLSRATRVAEVERRTEIEWRRRRRVLDLLALGVAAVAEDGLPLYENATAEGLRRANLWTPATYRRFAASGERCGSDAFAIGANEGGPLLVKSAPLRDAAGKRTMLLIMKPVRSVPRLSETAIERLFGVTPAEARVASYLALGLGVPRTAEILSLSPETVRTHLDRVFAKMGVATQSGLVRLLMQWATPAGLWTEAARGDGFPPYDRAGPAREPGASARPSSESNMQPDT